ncbi:sensor histidine kinase NtrY-like [Fodinicurvata fenggangensis]|uniref:sensor histidine kinase NtrY-like n=1 Tax=Fodinicurvata fenggangensis TaxID=1121830 RepID=UPI00068E7A39|nr:PAS domain-containing sensor histidine kinase [Fodinicurvata fenggangensis]
MDDSDSQPEEKRKLPARLYQRFRAWARHHGLERKLSVILLVAAVLSGVATFAAMTGRLPGAGDPRSILLLLVLDLVFLVFLGVLITRRLVQLWAQRRRAAAGARLHSRLVGLFALVTVLPSMIIVIFAVLLFEFGLQSWFSDRVSTAIRESLQVAQAYEEEHKRNIMSDVQAMASDLNRSGRMLTMDPNQFAQFVANQAAVRSLTEATVFQPSGRIMAQVGVGSLFQVKPDVPESAFQRAGEDRAVILTGENDNRVRALIKLDIYVDTYLLIGRLIDPQVLAHLEKTSAAVQLYEQLEGERAGLLLTFALIFLIVAILLLLAAAWVGLAFADRLSKPIGHLIMAADKVGAGDLSARVDRFDPDDEVGSLAMAFNRMASELQHQQEELLKANWQIEARRRFIETVLSGVSAGVIGLDRHHRVTVANRSACELLSLSETQLHGRRLSNLSRDVRSLIDLAGRRPGKVHERQVTLTRRDGYSRTFLVRIAAEQDDENIIGYVVTFDDISDLLSAQRKAAWADVARRIAHEIKNPLTPIQLSAERLKRKYLKQIDQDPETFNACIETIIRQVGDIGHMVDEFSSFARMPTPAMAEHDLRQLIQEAIDLYKASGSEIEIATDLPRQSAGCQVDPGQLRQVLTNLIKNASESIVERQQQDREGGAEDVEPGRIEITLSEENEHWVIAIADNGRGLPASQRERLTEPYVTTREGGTGLGLAIVKKIMEDHGGDIALSDREGGGALIRLQLPRPEQGRSEGLLSEDPSSGNLARM